ncbi:dynamin family protein [Staphylococcus simiae]|uniref:Dynamin N-terminal domain-containing protein n=1 Tax=Staphylococcus simiae CCM 7213 = CCUG 51256 TaxID=911238 RepID=G5JM30_9STAP|nr:dynamin family protein [Staphylococcus simiae]EHJ06769.1 hypothetical protein SS7213T_12767 [Staphylococcus simiae CCM 7213 = CCUG 51256]PNZ14896.1 GTP-binding protein [Staphylococcus simiae]
MTNSEQLDRLYKLKKEVEKSNNTALVDTINQVIKKVYLQQYTLSFVGHFSAGKSTLINLLLEQQILPSSPVPTTSNTAIVSVADNNEIIANLPNQQYTTLNSYDEVKAMNRQNVDVESVEINFQSSKFKQGFTLQDTPGVDSNVSSHQTMTEQFMYTSNMVFYTVDYNHVQSALNFKFMKHMNDVGIPVVFVINQVDKHNEDELTFDTFKSRVEQSITDWDINLERLFYVSKYDGPNNELAALSDYMLHLDEHRESLDSFTHRTIDYITEAQLSYLQNEIQDILDDLGIAEEDFEQAFINTQQNQAVSEEAQLLNNPQELMSFLKEQRKNILENAYLMTHDMRELLRSYLESMSKDFNVGGLFNKKKKKYDMQQQRLEQAVEALQQRVNQQIRQPMREDMSFVTRFVTTKGTADRVLNQHYEITATLIEDLYQPQTSISNTYVLTFSDDVVKAIRKLVEQESTPIFEDVVANVQADELATNENSDLEDFQRYTELSELRHSLETKNYRHYYIHLDESLDKLIDRTKTTYQYQQHESQNTNSQRDTTPAQVTTSNQQTISAALNVIQDVPLFEQTKQDIADTLQRLDDKVVKIGVFGTFSAGKSSLINALLGDTILVSSPNPTTAATTEISYGNTSSITLKSKAQLLDEINQVVTYHHMSFSTLEEFIASDISTLKAQLEKNQLAFINAVEKHYAMYDDMIAHGEQHTIQQDDLKKWSAEDEYATFVKKVHIALSHEWLKDKIIVDSLGLHSNNQRHSNETEQILTSSDLILYVSYFNHSFTDNDKAFIEHMKNMNQLHDHQAFKMIINAVDLAESDEDRQAVETYVEDALNQVNLQSDIYSVSSRQALQGNDNGINQLRDSIDQFATVESKVILEQQMTYQLQQINASYQQMINDYHTNKAELASRQQRLQQYQHQQLLSPNLISTTEQYTINEIEDQIYHLNGRLQLQILDDAKAIFNTQMTQYHDFNEEKKMATKRYLDQIHQRLYLEQSVLVERIKRYYNEQLIEQLAPTVKKLADVHVFVTPNFDIELDSVDQSLLTIQFEEMLNHLPKQLTKRKILNPTSQREIQQQITDQTLALLQHGLNELRQQLDSKVAQMSQVADEHFNNLEQDIMTQINELLSFNIDDALINQLQSKHQQLNDILK